MPKSFPSVAAAFLLLAIGGHQAVAQGLKAVRPLEGYKCMALNLSEDQMLHETNGPWIRQQPTGNSATLSQASAIVLVADPLHTENGFTQVVTFGGKPGWLESVKLKPLRNALNPSARCIPSVMSNGSYGFRG